MTTRSSHPDPFGTYYDPSPQQKLSRPIVVCSFFGAEGSHVAKRIAALGGWPHIDVYEQTAHALGEHRALSGVSIENPEWSSAEEQTIEHALFNQPYAVIGLTDGYMANPRILDLVNRLAHVVTVHNEWLEIQQRLLEEIDAAPERLPEFMETEIPDLHTLKILYGQRQHLYDSADVTLHANGLAAGIVARRATAAINELT